MREHDVYDPEDPIVPLLEPYCKRILIQLQRRSPARVAIVLAEAWKLIHEHDHPTKTDPIELPISALIGDVRIQGDLDRAGIIFVRELLKKSPASLLRCQQIGPVSLRIISEQLWKAFGKRIVDLAPEWGEKIVEYGLFSPKKRSRPKSMN
jgi:hypothetical protein